MRDARGSRRRHTLGASSAAHNSTLSKTLRMWSGDTRRRGSGRRLCGGSFRHGLGSCSTQGNTSRRGRIEVVNTCRCWEGWNDGKFRLGLAHFDTVWSTVIVLRKRGLGSRSVLRGNLRRGSRLMRRIGIDDLIESGYGEVDGERNPARRIFGRGAVILSGHDFLLA